MFHFILIDLSLRFTAKICFHLCSAYETPPSQSTPCSVGMKNCNKHFPPVLACAVKIKVSSGATIISIFTDTVLSTMHHKILKKN